MQQAGHVFLSFLPLYDVRPSTHRKHDFILNSEDLLGGAAGQKKEEDFLNHKQVQQFESLTLL